MTTGQFQLEADVSTYAQPRIRAHTLTPNAAIAGMSSLLIGLGARQWLTDHEKDFLDQLAPQLCISFLIHGDEYVHPEGVELFSPEQLDACMLSSGAVFSQQHRLSRLQSHACQVHTAYIGDLNGRSVTFGIAGPDNADTYGNIGDRFAHLVHQLRQACAEADHHLPRLLAKLNEPSPTLAINRNSGRIVAVNAAVCNLMKMEAREIVGLEFSQVKLHLSPAMAGSRVVMDNLQLGEISLALLSLAVVTVSVQDTINGVLPDFIRSLRKTTLSLHMTAHNLESVVCHEAGHPENELVRILDEEAHELELTIHRFRLLTEYQQLEKSPVNPANELRRVVNYTATKQPYRHLSLREHWEIPVKLTVPADSLASLYDTILHIHFGQSCRCSSTEVALNSDASGQLTIRFITQTPSFIEAMSNRNEWIAYSTALASLMGLRLIHIDGATIETTITCTEK